MTEGISRRSFTKVAFVGSLLALGAAGGAAAITMLYPRRSSGDDEVAIRPDEVPAVGEPPRWFEDGGFFLVNLASGEGYEQADGGASPGGLLALRGRCTHLHCEVQWQDDYPFNREREHRLVCPCHGGIYTKAGVRVFGPPPRSLDTMPLRVTTSGYVVVDTSTIDEGTMKNPTRAVPWPPEA